MVWDVMKIDAVSIINIITYNKHNKLFSIEIELKASRL